ncbi:glycosyltransferase family 2 protein [Chloroflexota bacterium]
MKNLNPTDSTGTAKNGNAYPQVSIVMSVYNGEKTLAECMRSVIDQTFKDFKFIIINDCSNDNSPDIIKEYAKKDARISIINNKENIGLTKSLNKGIGKAKGKYIGRIDADDWWELDKLEIQMKFIESNPDYGLVGTNVIHHNEYTGEIKVEEKPENDEEIKKVLLRRSPLVHTSIIVKKSLLDKYGAYDEDVKYGQDYELYFRLMNRTKFYNIQNPLCHRATFGKDSITLEKWKSQYMQGIKIRMKYYKKYHMPLITYLNLIPDLLKLMFPKRLKIIKQRLLKPLK